ncbi:hypothetical protein MMC11_000997 [Xylographa trunciseda]|nr:hypothetical protein [Xylographa trunciseda]
MSKVKGIGGLALATIFGVLNGVAIFGPALRDQELQKSEHTSLPDEAMQDVVTRIPETERTSSSSDVSNPASSKPTPAIPAVASSWSTPKLHDWKAFWMEGDRALKEKAVNSELPESPSPGDNVRRTTEDAAISSNSANS